MPYQKSLLQNCWYFYVPVSRYYIGNYSALGSVITAVGAADVTGVSATMVLGTISVTGTANVSITGLSAIGELGNETVWGLIIPDVGNTYTNITTGASQTWTEITQEHLKHGQMLYNKV